MFYSISHFYPLVNLDIQIIDKKKSNYIFARSFKKLTSEIIILPYFCSMASNEVNIKNKRARFEFFIEEEFTAGLKLAGTEIKSIRNGKASIIEAYCVWHEGELWIRNMYIAPYENASFYEHRTRGDRKLLLNRKELNRIEKFLKIKGNTVVPLKLFLSEKGWLKINIACAKGKKLHDKREDLKEKDDRREMDRALKR